jgi:hypothetical protein
MMEDVVVYVSGIVFKAVASGSSYIVYDQQKRLGEIYFSAGKWKSKEKLDDYLVNRLGYAIEKERKLK